MSCKTIQKTPVSNGRTSAFMQEVKAWVKSMGMTQRDLAKKLGVSYQLSAVGSKPATFSV